MLVLNRKKNQSILIGPDVEIIVVEIRGNCVRLGIRAPQAVAVDRLEVRKALEPPRGGPSHGDEKGGAA